MRPQRILQIVTVVLIVGIVVVAGALLRFVFAGGRTDAPRTELERAVVEAEQAVKANPDDPTARVKLAAAYLEQGSGGLALTQARFAVRLQPSDPSPYYVLGLAQDATGDRTGAITSLKKAAGMTGQVAQFYQDVYVGLAKVQEEQGDDKGALTSLGKAIEYAPENTVVIIKRAELNERDSKWYDAAADYSWVLLYDPQDLAAAEGFDRIAQSHPKEAKEAAAAVNQTNLPDLPAGTTSPHTSQSATGSK